MNLELDEFLKNKGKRRIVFLTGAGLSKESGINTFRDSDDGLWEEYDPAVICNIGSFYHNYNEVHNFYNALRSNLKNVEPNIGHYLISEIQKKYSGNVIHLTANVDDLCERAGGSAIHMHGNLTEVVENYSLIGQNYKVLDVGYEYYIPNPNIVAKPNVVMFGETIWFDKGIRKDLYDDRNKVLHNLTQDDLVIIIGSSDTVIRWSVLIGMSTPAQTINVNPEYKDSDTYYKYNLYKPITEVIPVLENYIDLHMNSIVI